MLLFQSGQGEEIGGGGEKRPFARWPSRDGTRICQGGGLGSLAGGYLTEQRASF